MAATVARPRTARGEASPSRSVMTQGRTCRAPDTTLARVYTQDHWDKLATRTDDHGNAERRSRMKRLWRDSILVGTLPADVSTPTGRSRERFRRIGLTTASSIAARGISFATSL